MVQIGDGATELVNCLEDIHGLLDRLGACVLSVNESLSFLPCRARPHASPKSRSADGSTPCTIVKSGLLNTEDVEASVAAAAADVDPLLGSTDESDRPFLPPDRTPSTTGTHNTGGDTASESALLQHSTALQEELEWQVSYGGTRTRTASLSNSQLEARHVAVRAA
ncbi:hypothetical protein EDB89DRAFT_2228355 [Lactarius sanguifluus]|nr:hypothetical protein EDB89DRAFT_2228355 [Lactarius sanguifluus]